MSLVHVIITGIISLQQIQEPTTGVMTEGWRVTVPNLSAELHEPHYAMLVALADSVDTVKSTMLPDSTSTNNLSLWLLSANRLQIRGVTRNPKAVAMMPDELVKFRDGACLEPIGDCGKVKLLSEFVSPPALELFINAAGASATWVDSSADWWFSRPDSEKRKGVVADEVCLTFETEGGQFSFSFLDANGATQELVLTAQSDGDIEILLANLPLKLGDAMQTPDPHFHHHYKVSKRLAASDPASLINKSKAGREIDRQHRHEISGIIETQAKMKKTSTTDDRSRVGMSSTTSAAALWKILSLAGSNCPPIGGEPYP